MSERIQKMLAAAGYGSRRGIEDWLRDGRISVNGAPAKLGDKALPTDRILLDGVPLEIPGAAAAAAGAGAALQRQILLYNKPVGEVTTRSDPQGRPTVFERLPQPSQGRWVVIGRLDVNTSGLLLFTNDGELAHRYMHPSFAQSREYLVRVRGNPPEAALNSMLRGLQLEDGLARFDSIVVHGRSEGHSWYRVGLHEGRNREVRRLWEAAGYEVSRLKRIAYGPFTLPEDLGVCQWRLASPAAVAAADGAAPDGAAPDGAAPDGVVPSLA
ncbi:MAG: pseudouridine synthase [Pseudomonadota bacterium]